MLLEPLLQGSRQMKKLLQQKMAEASSEDEGPAPSAAPFNPFALLSDEDADMVGGACAQYRLRYDLTLDAWLGILCAPHTCNIDCRLHLRRRSRRSCSSQISADKQQPSQQPLERARKEKRERYMP